MEQPGSWGRYPSTGRPVSPWMAGVSSSASRWVQPLRSTPAIWLGVRKVCTPFTRAARVRAVPWGRTASRTGVRVAWARRQLLARSVFPWPS